MEKVQKFVSESCLELPETQKNEIKFLAHFRVVMASTGPFWGLSLRTGDFRFGCNFFVLRAGQKLYKGKNVRHE